MKWEAWQEDYWIAAKDTPKKGVSKVAAWQASRVRKRDAIRRKLNMWNMKVRTAKPKFKQVSRFIEKFGGIIPFSIAVGIHPEAIINNWLNQPLPNYPVTPKSKYYITHGLIPPRYLSRVIVVARYWGVLLRSEDIYPDFVGDDGVKNFHNNEEIMRWIKSIQPNAKMKQFESDIVSLVSTPE